MKLLMKIFLAGSLLFAPALIMAEHNCCDQEDCCHDCRDNHKHDCCDDHKMADDCCKNCKDENCKKSCKDGSCKDGLCDLKHKKETDTEHKH